MDLNKLKEEALHDIERASSLSELDALQIRYLGRKEGRLTAILRNLGQLPPDEKKRRGQEANEIREAIESVLNEKKETLTSAHLSQQLEQEKIDVTLPGKPFPFGAEHPILKAIRDITGIFQGIGFDVAEGPEAESDQNNFTDLNIPLDHPARDMHDTFYLSLNDAQKGLPLLLRTHTSPVQIRVMKSMTPPIRMICPGRVFRHEATDATHAAEFHQLEGLAVDEGLTFSDLKSTLAYFAERYFGATTRVRFNPSYFPFVEPGAQMDVSCFMCEGAGRLKTGDGCSLCKTTGWIEMLGAGMVHPQVLRNVGYDPEKYTGFAFGMGIERIVMTRYQIRDIRLFLESDIRFLEQFS